VAKVAMSLDCHWEGQHGLNFKSWLNQAVYFHSWLKSNQTCNFQVVGALYDRDIADSQVGRSRPFCDDDQPRCSHKPNNPIRDDPMPTIEKMDSESAHRRILALIGGCTSRFDWSCLVSIWYPFPSMLTNASCRRQHFLIKTSKNQQKSHLIFYFDQHGCCFQEIPAFYSCILMESIDEEDELKLVIFRRCHLSCNGFLIVCF
jgi:hypothetical protein